MIPSQELDKKQFFQPVVETISQTLKLPACIWLADETGEALRIAAATELSEDYVRRASLRLDEPSVASDVFATGQTIVVTDIASDTRWKYQPETIAMGLRSAMVVPLRVKKKIVGVLDVYTHEVRDFSNFEEALIETFATQVAATQRRIQDLATLNEVSLLISSELRRADLFERIVQAAERVLDCQHVSIFLADESGDLVLKAASSPGIARKRFAPGEGLTGWVAQTKRSELVPDAVKHPQFAPGLSSDLVERSMVLAPIILEDEVIGVISADMDGLSGFDEHDRVLLEAVASQSAVAVHNARLLEQATNRAAVLQRLHQIGGRILSAELSARGLIEVLRQVVQSAKSVLGADLVDLYQYVETEDRYIPSPILEGERRVPTVVREIFEDDVVVKVVEGGKPLYSPDAQAAPLLTSPFTVVRPDSPDKRFVVREGILSSVAIPLKAAGETVGAMFVNYRTRQAFTPEQRGAIELFANQAAMAIYNARVYEQARGRIEALEALNEVGQTLTSGIRLKEEKVLELIHTQAGQLMDTDNMYIALYDKATDTVRFELAFVDGRRIDVKREKGWQPRQAGKGKTEEIIHTRKSLFHATKTEAEEWYAQPGHEEYVGTASPSWLGVPMMVGERVLGVIATYHPTRDYIYNRDDLTILQAMAHQAAIALDNAHMFYDVNQRLEALVEFGQMVTFSIRLREDEVLELIYSQASKLMDTDNMYIALYDEAMDIVRFGLAFVDGRRVDVETEQGWQPRKAGKGRTEEIIHTKTPIFAATKDEAEAWYAQLEHREYVGTAFASWLGVPMMVGEKVLGVIATYHPTRDYVYSSDDLEILQAMAELAAVALDNARLYEEARSEVIATKQLATLGTATAALQHRINNTFNIIVPNVTRLRKRVDMTDETIVEILDTIERNARYTSNIIARIQEPLREVEAQDVDVNAVLSDVVGKVREQWQEDPTCSMIAVTLDLDDSIPQIRSPIGQVAEVFRNLVDNAYRAMKAGGQLVVTSRLTDGEICVRVQDTGPGISPQVQQRLFVKPVPSKEPGGGAGLGLWLSRLILQSIGGDVIIEETDPTGTTMLVQIPAPRTGREIW